MYVYHYYAVAMHPESDEMFGSDGLITTNNPVTDMDSYEDIKTKIANLMKEGGGVSWPHPDLLAVESLTLLHIGGNPCR